MLNRSEMRRWILKALILLSVSYAMVQMWHWAMGFTFFTQLSNIFAAVTVLLQLILYPRKLAGMKFSATVSILVTFLVYLAVVAPSKAGGLIAAYREDHYSSLVMHLIVPLLMTTDFFVNDRQHPWTRKHCLIALIPPLTYFIFIFVLGQAGFSWWGMASPYPFLNYRAPAGWFGWMPETAGPDSLGIGVAWSVLVMIGLYWGISFVLARITLHGFKDGGNS